MRRTGWKERSGVSDSREQLTTTKDNIGALELDQWIFWLPSGKFCRSREAFFLNFLIPSII